MNAENHTVTIPLADYNELLVGDQKLKLELSQCEKKAYKEFGELIDNLVRNLEQAGLTMTNWQLADFLKSHRAAIEKDYSK